MLKILRSIEVIGLVQHSSLQGPLVPIAFTPRLILFFIVLTWFPGSQFSATLSNCTLRVPFPLKTGTSTVTNAGLYIAQPKKTVR